MAPEFVRLIKKQYIVKEILGTGTFSQVYHTVCNATGRAKAVKVIDPRAAKFGSESVEVELLRTCCHPHVIALEDVLHLDLRRASTATALVFPAFDLDLGRLLRLRRGFPFDFPNEHRLQIARGIWVGVAYLHSRQILHRDIKPANILIRFGSKVHTVLADMGLATNMSMPSVFAGRDAEKEINHTACVCTDGMSPQSCYWSELMT